MSGRERVEALVWIRADLRTLYRMGSEQRQNLSDLTRRLDENARQIADLLEGNGLRDLLAETKADAPREAADFCAPVYADSLGAGGGDFADGWRQASALFLAELRDRAANPYRETTIGGRDD